MFICSVPEIPSMPIVRFLRHGHIFHPARVLVCHSCAIVCNSLVFRLLHSSPLSYNVKKLYIPVNLLYSGDGAEFISCARAGTEDSAGPPHCVGPLPFREPMPTPALIRLASSIICQAGLMRMCRRRARWPCWHRSLNALRRYASAGRRLRSSPFRTP